MIPRYTIGLVVFFMSKEKAYIWSCFEEGFLETSVKQRIFGLGESVEQYVKRLWSLFSGFLTRMDVGGQVKEDCGEIA